MRLERLRMCGFRSAGPEPVELTLEDSTFLLGPNGAGKTAVLHALARMFGSEASLRRFNPGDFHVPVGEAAEVATARSPWIEADFVFPELGDEESFLAATHPTVPPHFAHMYMDDRDGQLNVRFRLSARKDENDEITDELVYVLSVDEDDEPKRKATVNRFDRNTIQVHYLPARRNPADHVSYAANSLLGRLMRAADWSVERPAVGELGKAISTALAGNNAVA